MAPSTVHFEPPGKQLSRQAFSNFLKQYSVGYRLVHLALRTQQRHGITREWDSNVRSLPLLRLENVQRLTTINSLCWPFHADQSFGAAHISEDLRAGIELIEVRTGESGLKPLRRNGRQAKGTRKAFGDEIRQVIDDSRGQKGKEIRKNTVELKAKLANAWMDGGIGKKDFETFLAKYNFL